MSTVDDDDYSQPGIPPGTKMGLIALGVVFALTVIVGLMLVAKMREPKETAVARRDVVAVAPMQPRANQDRQRDYLQEATQQVAEKSGVSPLVWIILCGLYPLPACIAFMRRHQNAAAILVLNLFLGWSGFGWIAALTWSLTASWRDEAAFRGRL